MELDDALAALYAVAPAEFVTRRDTIVAELRLSNHLALADQVQALRKPSLAAWSLNLLARSRPTELDRLPQLGRDLRSAQSLLTGNLIRSLSADRHRLVTAIVKLASDAAAERGHPLGPAAQQEVASTISAALVSGEATQAVTSGLLTRALTYAGFGDVDISGAIAQPTKAPREPAPARQRTAAPAVRTTPEPAAALTAAKDALAAADTSVALAEEELERLQTQRASLAHRVEELKQEMAQVRDEQRATETALAEAAVAVQKARTELRHAKAQVRRVDSLP
ncbi:MAG: hypothetical protein ACTHJ6_09000 [Oryzihumus sp.]